MTLCELEMIAEGRWRFAKDMNCDGLFTISDVFLWIEWLFFLPGDGLLWWLMQNEGLATFFELTPAAYSGWTSGVFSVIAWFGSLVLVALVQLLLEK